jgi:hypothetical protein
MLTIAPAWQFPPSVSIYEDEIVRGIASMESEMTVKVIWIGFLIVINICRGGQMVRSWSGIALLKEGTGFWRGHT